MSNSPAAKAFWIFVIISVFSGCSGGLSSQPAEPEWFEAYSDGGLTVRALYTIDEQGSGLVLTEMENTGACSVVLSSRLCLRAQRDGEEIKIIRSSGFDGIIYPGQTAEGSVLLECRGSEGVELFISTDYLADEWIALTNREG